jgi:acyl-CoA synthetase (AMP-forming)/AMP-acid ligase II
MTPVQFLRRASDVFPGRTAVIHGDIRWRDHDRRCRMIASALKRTGAGNGDIVAILCPNTPASRRAAGHLSQLLTDEILAIVQHARQQLERNTSMVVTWKSFHVLVLCRREN